MVLLPEPDTPITTSAQGLSPVSSLTEILRQRSLIRQPNRLAGGSHTVGGQVLAVQHARQDRTLIGARHLEQHLAAGVERRQGQRHPRHEWLDMCLGDADHRSEEHTSELQSHHDLVCRLLLEKKKKIKKK